MSHGKKPKRKKKKQPAGHEQSEGDTKLINKPDHVHVSGKIEVDFPEKLVEKYDTASDKENGWNRRQFLVSLITAILVFAYTTVAMWQGCSSQKAATAAKSAADTASTTLKSSQQQFKTDQRPYVFANPKHGTEIPTANGLIRPQIEERLKDGRVQIEIVVRVTNGGKSPAVNLRSTKSQMYIGTRNEVSQKFAAFVPEYDGGRSDILASGIEGHIVPTGEWLKLSPEEFKRVLARDLVVYVMGAVKYTDVFAPPLDAPYETTYCFLYLPAGVPFGGCGGSIK